MIIILQALSLVEKAEPVQVHFSLSLRDQRNMWMQDGCKVYMDSYMASEWIMCRGHLAYFLKPPPGGRPNTKPGDHGILNTYNRWFILFYHMWGPTWIENHWNSIGLRTMVTYDFTLHLRIRDHTTWFWRCVGTAFGHFLLGSHNFMVTALGSCVKWP